GRRPAAPAAPRPPPPPALARPPPTAGGRPPSGALSPRLPVCLRGLPADERAVRRRRITGQARLTPLRRGQHHLPPVAALARLTPALIALYEKGSPAQLPRATWSGLGMAGEQPPRHALDCPDP